MRRNKKNDFVKVRFCKRLNLSSKRFVIFRFTLIADPMTGTEIINRALSSGSKYTSTGWRYKMVMVANADGQQVLNVVRADEVIEDFRIADTDYLLSARHGESIEDMVNKICAK